MPKKYRRRRRQKRLEKLLDRLLYFSLSVLIFLMAVRGYFFWYENYKLSHPEIVEVRASGYLEEQPLEGILLWDEQLLYATRDGVCSYLSQMPRMVAKGEVVAAIDGSAVRAPYAAYFYPALDGQEGRWAYSRLWPDFAPFPTPEPARVLDNGVLVRKGEPIGKLVPQPQELRCAAYLDNTPSLARSLSMSSPTVDIRLQSRGREVRADVVAFKASGQKLKVYLRLPFFPPSILRSRSFSARVVSGSQQGVMVPDSAVIVKDQRNIVFLLHGNVALSRDVDGFPADDRNFFIVRGVVPGNRLIRDASAVQDGEMRLW